MIRRIGELAAESSVLTGYRKISPQILAIMADVPRHLFVSEDLAGVAYADRALPINHGQTVSQPFIVALMTELLDVRQDDKVLEIGTGSGYQTAVLARLTNRLYSIEVLPDLARDAAARLLRVGAEDVHLRQGDGSLGWPEEAPFDRIMVTAAPHRLPVAFLEQLAPGGLLVAPLGPSSDQQLMLWQKDVAGAVHRSNILPVAFVPLIGVSPPEASVLA
jgi:protein-L-isoaspartate(D-aspartate) O-methyltransferase